MPLTLRDEAYNACIIANHDAKQRLDAALLDYNKTAAAANSIYSLRTPEQLKLVPCRG